MNPYMNTSEDSLYVSRTLLAVLTQIFASSCCRKCWNRCKNGHNLWLNSWGNPGKGFPEIFFLRRIFFLLKCIQKEYLEKNLWRIPRKKLRNLWKKPVENIERITGIVPLEKVLKQSGRNL